jgi:light-regulated signal transduction histidine kinase (bacteriophytochrome)
MNEYIKEAEAEVVAERLPVITGNDNQVFYLFKNLLNNAIKFQFPGNQPIIKITAEQVAGHQVDSAKADESRDYCKVSFEDNGLGLDPKYFKKIFQVFQRLHNKNEYEGTGMGLAICRKIMENHGGFIKVESEPDKGSVFSCYFPII